MSPFNLRKVHNQKTSYSWSFPESNVRYIISECIGENDNPNAYIIYIDNELDLDWEVINRDPEKELYINTSQKSIQKILSRISYLSAIPHKQQNESVVLQYKQMLGEALLKAFNEDLLAANQLLDNAASYISERNIEQSRYWQLLIMLLILIGIAILSYFLWCNFDSLKIDLKKFLTDSSLKKVNDYSLIFLSFVSCIFGTFGAVVSISQRMGSLKISANSPFKMHFFEISFKIICSILVSFIITALIVSGQFIPKVVESMGIYSIMVFTFLGGSSERFVSSVLINSENTKDTTERMQNE